MNRFKVKEIIRTLREKSIALIKKIIPAVQSLFQKTVTAVRNFDVQKCRVSMCDALESMQSNGRVLVITFVSAFLLMVLVCLAVFFITVRAPEKVMVPDVTGKDLTTALLELQVKELYPKIQLRYTNTPDDQGKILNQSPDAGAIVKAGRRVTLTVSRGVVVDHIGGYVGEKIDDVRIKLQSLFTGTSRPLVVLADPVYKADQSEAGTILEQDPPEGTKIAEPVTVHLIVSRGPDNERARVPELTGMSVNDVLMVMSHTKIIFDFTFHAVENNEKIGTVITQQKFDTEFVDNYTHMSADFAFPKKTGSGLLYGIFTDTITEYPYPVRMSLDAVPPEGERYTLVTFSHTGGTVTVPYALQEGTSLILTVVGKEVKHQVVQ
jgi:eukaryotic-like serine/threonine-protein kinase